MRLAKVLVVDVETAFPGVPVTASAVGRDFFGRTADVEVAADEVMWCWPSRPGVSVVVDADRAGHGLVSLSVADLDGTLAELGSRGIVPISTEVVGDAGRKATVFDPDGSSVTIIEVRS